MSTPGIKLEGHKGFGSFHTEDVEALIRQSASEYGEPKPAVKLSADEVEMHRAMTFGPDARASCFLVDPSWTFVNHGAFGACFRSAMAVANQWRAHAEEQPLRFIDRDLFPLLVRATRRMADFVGADPTRIVLIQNATTGLNAVLRSTPLGPGKCVFMLDLGYGAVKTLSRHACEVAASATGTSGTEKAPRVLMATVPMPPTREGILDVVRAQLPADGSCALAIFDHVTSNTALCLPVRELVELCRSRDVPVLIDGAHSLLAIPLALDELGADYYVTNCHKWFCAPKGAALLYCMHAGRGGAPPLPLPRPLIVSHGAGRGFISDFIWDGHRDYSSLLALPEVLRVWEAVGVERARTYMKALLGEGVELLVAAWGTRPLTTDETLREAPMALVELPLHGQRREHPPPPPPPPERAADAVWGAAKLPFSPPLDGPADGAHAKAVQDCLHFGYNVECPVKCIDGMLYARVSAHLYNSRADFEALAAAVNGIGVPG